MDPIAWIEYVDSVLKRYGSVNYNPFPNLFFDLEDYRLFLDENLDILPIVKDIYGKLKPVNKKLYIICLYILCLKFYSEIPLKYPVRMIEDVFGDEFYAEDIIETEIDILKTIDYIFPI